jgi:hypothetical protein
MDEIGYQLSHSQNELVVFDRRIGAPLSLTSGSTGWCSVLESISATGDTMKPLVILISHPPRVVLSSLLKMITNTSESKKP